DPAEKVSIVFHEFTRTHEESFGSSSPITKSSLWIYIVGGLLLLFIIILIVIILLRRKNPDTQVVEEPMEQEEPMEIPDLMESELSEGDMRRKQLEKMAKDNPEEFTKL